jgi:hypothetical protein
MSGTARGLFNVNSISVMVGCKQVDAYGPVLRHLSKAVLHDDQSGLFLTAKWADMAWEKLSVDERLALLVSQHEGDHFTNFTSSPLCLLMWRTNELLLALVALLLRTLDECGLDRIPPGQDLVTWFNTAGLAFLKEQAHHNRLPPVSDDMARYGSVSEILQELVQEIDILYRFQGILFGVQRPDITFGEFLPLADEVYALLARHWNRPWNAKWSTRTPLHYPLYPDPASGACLTTPELLEGLARLRERRILEATSASADEIAEWEQLSIKGIYKTGYELLLTKLGSIPSAYFVGKLALASPVDLECNQANKTEIFVEDVLPIYRLARLTLALPRVIEHPAAERDDALDRFGLADSLLWAAGMPSLTETLAPIVQHEIDPLPPLRPIVSSLAVSSNGTSPSDLYDYRRYAFSMIEKFQNGHRQSLHSLLPPGRLAAIFLNADKSDEHFLWDLAKFKEAILDQDERFATEPDLTIFCDHITFNGRRATHRAFAFGDNMLHLLFMEACRSLVRPTRRMRRPDDLIAMFVERLERATESYETADTPLGYALKHQQTLELAREWQELRRLWPSTETSVGQFWAYLRSELGGTGERSLRSRLYDQPLFT